MIQVGDIVEVAQYPGQTWVVMAPALGAIPVGRLWHLRRESDGKTLGHTAGDGDLTVVDHPQFVAGATINYAFAHDGRATVVADFGEVVRISYRMRRPRSLDREVPPGVDGASFVTVELDADRGALVAMQQP
jgi:hypothetical protein